MKKKKKSAADDEGKKRKKMSWKGKEDSAEKPEKPDSTPKPPTEPEPQPEPEIPKPKEGKKKPKLPPKKVQKKPEPQEEALPEDDDAGCVKQYVVRCPKKRLVLFGIHATYDFFLDIFLIHNVSPCKIKLRMIHVQRRRGSGGREAASGEKETKCKTT